MGFREGLLFFYTDSVLFRSLRYVMEVIQRGRTAVRPALVPLLNTVPAVSDMELSEAECVHLVAPVMCCPCLVSVLSCICATLFVPCMLLLLSVGDILIEFILLI